MNLKGSPDIITAINEEHYDETLNFTETQGLSFAFALQGKPDISYAEIQYYVSEWDYDGAKGHKFYKIDSHNCTREELGLTGDHSKFKPIRERSKAVLESQEI